MNSRDSLGDRMKAYEKAGDQTLPKRMPVILRLDGVAFHTYTKKLKEPFHEGMHTCMLDTMEHLCKNIQNAVVGYTQSDEITIVLNNWKELTTESWFGNRQGKMIGVAAAMATAQFNESARLHMPPEVAQKFAYFDCRAFIVPKEDVCNNFIWRQQDATRNSIQMLGQSQFSHKQLQGKNNNQVQHMLITERDINWNDLDVWKKRGTAWTKDGGIDTNTPIFQENRSYIEDYLLTNEVREGKLLKQRIEKVKALQSEN